MVELRPYPFGALVSHMFRGLAREHRVFNLHLSQCVFGEPSRDLSVDIHGHRASTPLGPAAGPHSQMAQNIVSSWVAGCRVIELKTVQVNDALELPRPCIDMATVGYNVEWSQELGLRQSLEEYVKGSMLIEMLRASEALPLAPGFDEVVFDMSVGYDLRGIQSPTVTAFIEGMLDARAIVEQLRAQIPDEFAALRELPFRTKLSDTVTLSTFHGCRPDEIEAIVAHLLQRHGLHSTVKLNPTLLGARRIHELLVEVMGYDELVVPDGAFTKDTRWEQILDFVPRLAALATSCGRSFGVKFSNTLVVENHREFLPTSEAQMYLSGRPLHVLAMNLVRDFRAAFGAGVPVSFSAGIDRHNFADALALALAPVTVCSDLLAPGGYARVRRYFDELHARLDEVGARTLSDYVIRAYGHGGRALAQLGRELDLEPAQLRACEAALAEGDNLRAIAGAHLYAHWVARTAELNTGDYVARATVDPRYGSAANSKPPRKLDSRLALFDCLNCNKCVPVCPNDANFSFELPRLEQDIVELRHGGDGWTARRRGKLVIAKQRQYGTFADFCNECGNCDVFCPEHGGPYLVKPRFFGNVEDWRAFSARDGFACEPSTGEGAATLWGRINGREYGLRRVGRRAYFRGPDFAVEFDLDDPLATIEGSTSAEIELTWAWIMARIHDAVYGGDSFNYLSSLATYTQGAQHNAASDY